MIEGMIISKELEDLIDRENVFGSESFGGIPLEIDSTGSLLKTNVSFAKITDETIELEFLSKPDFAQKLIVHNNIKSIIIGKGSKNSLDIKNCHTQSITAIAKDDMYLCKIIVERSE